MILCPFCQIIEGERNRPILIEDDSIIAFLPLRPSHDGHVLVMPKAHYPDFCQIPEGELSRLFMVVRRLSNALKALFKSPKVAIYSMGLEVEHAHLHLIPVFAPYDLTTRAEYEHTARERSRAESERISEAIKRGLHLAWLP